MKINEKINENNGIEINGIYEEMIILIIHYFLLSL